MASSLETATRGRTGLELDSLPWPYPPWLTTRPRAKAGSTSQRTKPSIPHLSGKGGNHISPKEQVDPEDKLHKDEVVIEFFGQLWAIDSPPPHRNPRPPAPSTKLLSADNLFWIQRELVESRSFSAKDCYPVLKSDRLEKPPVKVNFTRDIWGRGGEKETFAEVLQKEKMADGGRWVWQPEPRRQPPQRPTRPPPPPQNNQLRGPTQQGWQDPGRRQQGAPRPPPPLRPQQQQPPPLLPQQPPPQRAPTRAGARYSDP